MGRRTFIAAVALACLGAAGPALADPTVQTISGSPLTLHLGGEGQFQALRTGETSGLFFAPQKQFGDAGFFLAFPAAQPAALTGTVYGIEGTSPDINFADFDIFTPISQTSSGDGSVATPFQVVSTYAVEPQAGTPLATVQEIASYVNGSNEFLLQWKVTNNTAQPLPYKALVGADFYFEGDDEGTGVFTPGPPRFVGGTNVDSGRSGGFVETTTDSPPWSHYTATRYSTIWTDTIGTAADNTNPTFDDQVLGDPDDNAGGVEWDDALTAPLASHATRDYAVIVRSAVPAALQFNQTNAGAPQHTPITFVATAKDTSGVALAGKALRYSITGANPVPSGSVTIDPSGNGAITDPGTNAGADTVIAYVDLNGNGSRDINDPQASALATFVDNIPPSCAVKVSGDRPGGSGGAGKPLVITVNCDSPATLTTQSSLVITPKARKSAAAATHKPKKPKKVTVKLPVTTTTVQPGQAAPVDIKVPKSVAKKYGGAKVTAKVVVTAVDTAGNRSTKTASRTVTLRTYKVAKKHHKG